MLTPSVTWRRSSELIDDKGVYSARMFGDVDELLQQRKQLVSMGIKDERLQQPRQLLSHTGAQFGLKERLVEVEEDLVDATEDADQVLQRVKEAEDELDGVIGVDGGGDLLHVMTNLSIICREIP